MQATNDSSIFAIKAREFVNALRALPNYPQLVHEAHNIQFEGAPADDKKRLVLCSPNVQEEVRRVFPDAGFYTRIRLAIPEDATIRNVREIKVEVFIAKEGMKYQKEEIPVIELPRALSLAVETELFHLLLRARGVEITQM